MTLPATGRPVHLRRKCSLTYVLIVATIALLGASAARADKTLAEKLSEVVDQAEFRHAHWGILISDQQTGEAIYELNADKLFAPASTTKLFTTAASLDAFGANHRFVTPIVRRGEVNAEGRLDGDLILVASGDLTMGGRTDAEGHVAFTDVDHTYSAGSETAKLTTPDPLAGLDQLARLVAASGIRSVAGDVLIDDRLFDHDESTGSGPGRVTPIVINDNLIDVMVTPGTASLPATLATRPPTSLYAVENQVRTVAAGKPTHVAVRLAGPGKLEVTGEIAADHAPLLVVWEVDDPARFARALLIEALTRAGVTVEAGPAAAAAVDRLPASDVVATLPHVAEFQSPPLSEEIKLVLKVSHNLHASTLPLLVAAKNGKRTLGEGLRLERDFLKRVGVDVETISFGGGAGGSRADYVTPRATVALLRAMAGRPDFAAYEQGLPVLGVDGTLAEAVPADSPARSMARAKTGTFYWYNGLNDRQLLISKALAGYETATSGRKLVFAFFVNNVHLARFEDRARIGRTLGHLCEIVHASL